MEDTRFSAKQMDLTKSNRFFAPALRFDFVKSIRSSTKWMGDERPGEAEVPADDTRLDVRRSHPPGHRLRRTSSAEQMHSTKSPPDVRRSRCPGGATRSLFFLRPAVIGGGPGGCRKVMWRKKYSFKKFFSLVFKRKTLKKEQLKYFIFSYCILKCVWIIFLCSLFFISNCTALT